MSKSLLIVDDDAVFCDRLAKAMARRGYVPHTETTVPEAIKAARRISPAFAVIDLRIHDASGLDVVDAVQNANPRARTIILSGYGNIPNAVAAAKAGVLDFMPKPADADDIEKALLAPRDGHAPPPEAALSPTAARRAHIERILRENDGNVSATARMLNMHRRTLQRMLVKGDLTYTPATDDASALRI